MYRGNANYARGTMPPSHFRPDAMDTRTPAVGSTNTGKRFQIFSTISRIGKLQISINGLYCDCCIEYYYYGWSILLNANFDVKL